MSTEHDTIVPWGRSYNEYVRMFALTTKDLKGRILGCGDGPASFNCEMTKQGYDIVSIDPIYQFNANEIAKRIDETYQIVIKQTYEDKDNYIWDDIQSVEELGDIRMSAMCLFLDDYELGRRQGRYIATSLPNLPFGPDEFDLALCSHFLFLYTDQLTLDFHRKSIAEMCRVSREVRVFPLLDLQGNNSSYLPIIQEEFANDGRGISIDTVPYEFQRGGNKMLKITSNHPAMHRKREPLQHTKSKRNEVNPITSQYDSAILVRIAETRMPFGKYANRPLVNLPESYLAWFSRKGFPTGELGRMLNIVWEIKSNGLDHLLDPIRESTQTSNKNEKISNNNIRPKHPFK
ncbi:MAG: DUF3820 family protein [Chloroflexota bacterium]|nr:DUF3820 family protein [Chloroflexota bacterium]